MKKSIMFLVMLLSATSIFAMTSVLAGVESSISGIDLGSFAGIVAVISTIATQIFKVIPSISTSRIAKIGVSILVGIALCMIAWVFHVSLPLSALLWWQVIIYGVAAGLSGCGFYDVIKAISDLIKRNKVEK